MVSTGCGVDKQRGSCGRAGRHRDVRDTGARRMVRSGQCAAMPAAPNDQRACIWKVQTQALCAGTHSHPRLNPSRCCSRAAAAHSSSEAAAESAHAVLGKWEPLPAASRAGSTGQRSLATAGCSPLGRMHAVRRAGDCNCSRVSMLPWLVAKWERSWMRPPGGAASSVSGCAPSIKRRQLTWRPHAVPTSWDGQLPEPSMPHTSPGQLPWKLQRCPSYPWRKCSTTALARHNCAFIKCSQAACCQVIQAGATERATCSSQPTARGISYRDGSTPCAGGVQQRVAVAN